MSPAPQPSRDTQPRVLDLTVPHRAARIDFDVSPAYEVIAALQALSSPHEWSTYEQGAAWFDDLRSRMSDRLRREIDLLPTEECRAEWAHLAGLVAAAPRRDDIDQVIDHLASLPPAAIYRSLIESGLPHAARRQHADLVEAAASGDHAARDRLLALAGASTVRPCATASSTACARWPPFSRTTSPP